MGIEKIQDKINELLNALTDAGYDNEIDIKLPVACHVDFYKELESKKRPSLGAGSSDPTAPIKFRYGAGNVNLLKPDPSTERRPILMSGDSASSYVKKKVKEEITKKPAPNLDALLFEADMRRL